MVHSGFVTVDCDSEGKDRGASMLEAGFVNLRGIGHVDSTTHPVPAIVPSIDSFITSDLNVSLTHPALPLPATFVRDVVKKGAELLWAVCVVVLPVVSELGSRGRGVWYQAWSTSRWCSPTCTSGFPMKPCDSFPILMSRCCISPVRNCTTCAVLFVTWLIRLPSLPRSRTLCVKRSDRGLVMPPDMPLRKPRLCPAVDILHVPGVRVGPSLAGVPERRRECGGQVC